MTAAGIVVLVVLVFVAIVVFRTIRIIPQARAGVVERLGRYQRTLDPGLALLVPFVDRLKPLIDRFGDRVLPVDQFLWSPHMELVGVFER